MMHLHMDGSGDVGDVLRDHGGEAIAGMACTLENVLSAASTKALALLRGLKFVDLLFGGHRVRFIRTDALSCSSVIIESDSYRLANGVIEVWSTYSTIMAECFLKANSMRGVLFQHCNRDANLVAHSLAWHVYESKRKSSLGW
jgi:hypothetical protein